MSVYSSKYASNEKKKKKKQSKRGSRTRKCRARICSGSVMQALFFVPSFIFNATLEFTKHLLHVCVFLTHLFMIARTTMPFNFVYITRHSFIKQMDSFGSMEFDSERSKLARYLRAIFTLCIYFEDRYFRLDQW